MNERKQKIPRFETWLLKKTLPQEEMPFLFDDIEEIYFAGVEKQGSVRARLWLWGQILRSAPRFIHYSFSWRLAMIKNVLKMFLRNFKRQKGYSIINLTGLAIGLACCALISLYLFNELSFDRYHVDADKIFRVCTRINIQQSDIFLATSNNPIGLTLQRDYPEVLSSVRVRPMYSSVQIEVGDRTYVEQNVIFAEQSLFDVFSFHFLMGDRQNALSKEGNVVLTRTVAEKYFGSADPLGKVLKIDKSAFLTVAGVMDDVPPQSHFRFDMAVSFENFYRDNPGLRERWNGDFNNYTYLRLRNAADASKIEAGFPGLVDKNLGRILKAVNGKIEFSLQTLTRIHLYSDLIGDIAPQNDISNISLFSIIAVFILLIACFNFMNLSTARSTRRAKEVGIRKVLGSQRHHLVIQLLSESLLFSLAAAGISGLLILLLLPLFQSLTGGNYSMSWNVLLWLGPGLLGCAAAAGLLAGIYPAFFLSGFSPALTVKGQIGGGKSRSRFRSLLVVLQFSVSIALFIGTLVILSQIRYMTSKSLGFNKEQVLVFQVRERADPQAMETALLELKNTQGVIEAAASSHVPSRGARRNAVLPEGRQVNESEMLASMSVGPDFLSTMGMDLVSGRNFDREHSSDSRTSCLLNQTAAELFGWDDPIGKTVQELDGRQVKKTVIGIVKDFHFMSLHNPIEPLLLEFVPENFSLVSVRIQPENIQKSLQAVTETWKNVMPGKGADYFFLDQSMDGQYRAEERQGRLFSSFSFLALFVACLGLFGLAAYSVEQRTKEIGIRKVLGSTASHVVYLLAKDFVRWVIFANVIAWPIAFFFMSRWLKGFAYHVDMSWPPFLLAGAGAAVVAVLTVGWQSFKAALSHPADALRFE